MDFEPTDDQRMAVDAWGRHVERAIVPITRQHQDSAFPKEVAHALLRETMAFGVGNGWVPEEDGGYGLDFLSSGLLFERLAYHSPDCAGLAWVVEGAALKIAQSASSGLKDMYLPSLLAGERIACSAVSEPSTGSDARSIRTSARRDGKHYRLNGEKLWTSNASVADLVLVLARTAERGLTLFLLDRDKHQFETREIAKLGLNGWSMGQVVMHDTVVGEDHIVGALDAGLTDTMKGFERSRCFVSTLALGIAQAALDAAIAYARERTQFGKPIAGHQMVQGLLAQMATELEAARWLVYRALWKLSRGGRCDMEAAMAKSYATEAATRITSNAIQVHGAFGLTREFPLERHFRNARMLTIPDGTTQINQLIIGRLLTGVNAFT